MEAINSFFFGGGGGGGGTTFEVFIQPTFPPPSNLCGEREGDEELSAEGVGASLLLRQGEAL